MTRRLIHSDLLPDRHLRGLGVRRVEPDRSRAPASLRVVNTTTGIPLRDGGEWLVALCSGNANPHPEDVVRSNYIIMRESREAEGSPQAQAGGGAQLALIEPGEVIEFGWIDLAVYLRAKGHQGYELARVIVPFRDRVLAAYEEEHGSRPPKRPVQAGGRLVEDLAFSEKADRALLDRVYAVYAATLTDDLAA